MKRSTQAAALSIRTVPPAAAQLALPIEYAPAKVRRHGTTRCTRAAACVAWQVRRRYARGGVPSAGVQRMGLCRARATRGQ